MEKRLLMLAMVAVLMLTVSTTAELSKTMPLINHSFSTGDEKLPDGPVYPLNPSFATDSPGIMVGTTWYDQQTNGSTGNRAVICNDGSKYFCWMKLLGWPYPPAPRYIYHNWMDIDGNLNPNGFDGQVNVDAGAGYTTMDLIYGNRGAIVYHSAGDDSPTYVTVSVDYDPPGDGFFDDYDTPDEIFPQDPDAPGRLYWPYIAVGQNYNIHVVMNEKTDYRIMRMCYCNSTDGGNTWSSVHLVDTVMVLGSVIDASPVSDRVAIAYSKTQDTTTQWCNDIVYVVSEDGITWDFQNDMVNITNYNADNDSLWAYTDLDVIIDYNDIIHIIWNAQWVTDEGIYYRTFLFHYSEETEEITEITHHPDSFWLDICGAWNRPICKMNLGAGIMYSEIYAIWTQFDTSDVSAGGYGNGEIYMSYSEDGSYWSYPENLTNSQTDGCYPGQCDSDHWATLADVVNDNLHILFIEDKDAGGIPQTEGMATENPVKYLSIPTGHGYNYGWIHGHVTEADGETPIEGAVVRALIGSYELARDITDANGYYEFCLLCGSSYDIEASKEGFETEVVEDVYANWDVPTVVNFQLQQVVGIDNRNTIPLCFSLAQNYPNPFNAVTTISFSLKDSGPTLLEVFDITGSRVATLIDEILPVGAHMVNWDASDFASGVYFYKITSGRNKLMKKAVLLK